MTKTDELNESIKRNSEVCILLCIVVCEFEQMIINIDRDNKRDQLIHETWILCSQAEQLIVYVCLHVP